MKRKSSFTSTPVKKAKKPAMKRQSATFIPGEMKYYDTQLQITSLAAVTTTWVAGTQMSTNITSVNLGDAATASTTLFAPIVSANLNGRIGRKVKVLKIRVQGFINVPPQTAQGATDSPTQIRLALVQDTQTNAANMTGAQLFNDAAAASNTLNSFQNPNNFGRFKVLKEKRFSLGNLNMAGSPTTADVIQAGITLPFKFNIKFREPVQVNFNATNGGTIADIIDNSWHMICGANSIAYAPTITSYNRVCYKE